MVGFGAGFGGGVVIGRNLNGAIGNFYAAYGEAVGTAKAVERNAHSALLRELG